jgi:hypothetical protein
VSRPRDEIARPFADYRADARKSGLYLGHRAQQGAMLNTASTSEDMVLRRELDLLEVCADARASSGVSA